MGAEVALKAVCRDMCRRRDIQREYHYASHLDHRNLAAATGRLFQTDLYFVYPMEYAHYGDLASYLSSRTIEEVNAFSVTMLLIDLKYLREFYVIHFEPLIQVSMNHSTCKTV